MRKSCVDTYARRERGTKAAIRARVEYIFMIKKAPALSAGFVKDCERVRYLPMKEKPKDSKNKDW